MPPVKISLTLISAAATLFTSTAEAHAGCHGQELTLRKNLGMTGLPFKRDVSTPEATQAAIQGAGNECNPYNFDYSGVFLPAAGAIASLVNGDANAAALFSTIDAAVKAKLPNIQPRGTPTGNFAGVTYSPTSDVCWWTWDQCLTPSNWTGLASDTFTVPEPNTYGLTYDDGPLCNHNEFYNLLSSLNQKATMFYIGTNVWSWPLQAQRAAVDGHEIGIHTWSHPYLTSLSNEQVFAELYYCIQVIKKVAGVTPKAFRPPYGDIDNRVRMIASMLNLTSILWSDDTSDYTLDSGASISAIDSNYQAIINQKNSGQYNTGNSPIVLSHEISTNTVTEAMGWLPKIRAAFDHVVPISVAFNLTNPYAETDIVFPTFAQYIAGLTNSSVLSANNSYSSGPSATPSMFGSASSVSALISASKQRMSASGVAIAAAASSSPVTSSTTKIASEGKRDMRVKFAGVVVVVFSAFALV